MGDYRSFLGNVNFGVDLPCCYRIGELALIVAQVNE